MILTLATGCCRNLKPSSNFPEPELQYGWIDMGGYEIDGVKLKVWGMTDSDMRKYQLYHNLMKENLKGGQ